MLDENKSSLLEQISACEREIKKRGVQIKHLVDAECSQLLGDLEKVKRERIKKIQTRKGEVEAQLLMLSSAKTYVEELVEKGSACAISQSAKDLLARAKQLHADQVEFSKGRLSPNRVTFEPAPIQDVISGPTGIGSIIVSSGASGKLICQLNNKHRNQKSLKKPVMT